MNNGIIFEGFFALHVPKTEAECCISVALYVKYSMSLKLAYNVHYIYFFR